MSDALLWPDGVPDCPKCRDYFLDGEFKLGILRSDRGADLPTEAELRRSTFAYHADNHGENGPVICHPAARPRTVRPS